MRKTKSKLENGKGRHARIGAGNDAILALLQHNIITRPLTCKNSSLSQLGRASQHAVGHYHVMSCHVMSLWLKRQVDGWWKDVLST